MKKVFVAIPSTGQVSDVIPYALRQYEKDYAGQIEFVYPKDCVHRRFHDFARNALVDEFLESDADILWFLDSDIVPPPHLMDLVSKHGEEWELAGAPYPVMMTPDGYTTPQVVFCVYTADEKGMHAAQVPFEGQRMVDGLATGCMFIKREVFAQLSKPYFEFKFDRESRYMTEGEDLGFCAKVNALGHKFFTDFSMVCGHYKTVNLMDVNAYAVQYANASTHNTIEKLKEDLDASLRAAWRSGYEKGSQAAGKTASGIILP